MSATGRKGHHPACCLVFVVVVFIVGSCPVLGRPQSHGWGDSQGPGLGSSPPELRFAPELRLGPALERPASPPAYNLPRQPASSPPLAKPAPHGHRDDLKSVGREDRPDFSKDLDGPEDQWERDPDVEDSDTPPTRRWPGRAGPDPAPQRKKAIVPPVVKDDLNVDRFHGTLFGFHGEDGEEDLDTPELRLKLKDSAHAPSGRSGYSQGPHRTTAHSVSSPEVVARDVDVDGPPLPKAFVPMPDDVPADPDHVVPWQQMLNNDVDVDRPIPNEASLPRPRPDSTSAAHSSLQQWKQLALGDLVEDEDDETLAAILLDADRDRNPFEDDEEEDNEVPEELVREVIRAMEASPSWRQQAASAPRRADQLWAEGEGGEGEERGPFLGWRMQGPDGAQGSRLITLILESVNSADDDQPSDDEDDEDFDDASEEMYRRKLSLWQILTNFPFPMLARPQSRDGSFPVTYTYDDDDDYEEYDDEDYYDDYDDDEYEDYQDDDDDDDDDYEEEDEDDDDEEEKAAEDQSDKLDDYFYDEEYDECNDCIEAEETAKEEIAVLSLAPLLTK